MASDSEVKYQFDYYVLNVVPLLLAICISLLLLIFLMNLTGSEADSTRTFMAFQKVNLFMFPKKRPLGPLGNLFN